jgi:hypothetical protein
MLHLIQVRCRSALPYRARAPPEPPRSTLDSYRGYYGEAPRGLRRRSRPVSSNGSGGWRWVRLKGANSAPQSYRAPGFVAEDFPLLNVIVLCRRRLSIKPCLKWRGLALVDRSGDKQSVSPNNRAGVAQAGNRPGIFVRGVFLA